MIQYEFDARFFDAIAAGDKRATLRRLRTRPQRHARPGERIECWAWVKGLRLMIRPAEAAEILGVWMELGTDSFRMGPIIQNRNTWLELDPGGREGLARLTGHPGGWKEAAADYAARYGTGRWQGVMISWRDLDYTGPIPSRQQLRDLRVLAAAEKPIIPSYGKISPTVAHSLLVLKWAEVTDRGGQYLVDGHRGTIPVIISELGRQILERFGP